MARSHVVLVTKADFRRYLLPDGTAVFEPGQHDITLVTTRANAANAAGWGVSRTIVADLDDEQAVAAAEADLVAGPRPDWIAASSERLLLPVARLRERLGLPGYSADQISLLRDKEKMKRHFAAHGIRTPELVRISEPLEARELLAKYGTIVVKPVASAGAFDMHVISREAELEALQARGFMEAGDYVVEEYIDGRLFHVDSVVRRGRPVIASASSYLDGFTSFGFGSQLRSYNLDSGPERDMLLEFNRSVLEAIDWFSGATHLEVFIDRENRPIFCEIAGRAGGGGIIPAFHHTHAAVLPSAVILPQIGREIPDYTMRQPQERQTTGWSMIYPTAAGHLVSYGPTPQEDWIVYESLRFQPGDPIGQAESSGQAAATVTVCGPDSATVIDRLNTYREAFAMTVA